MPLTFVLVNGAWHGGWAWRPVAEHLRAAGCAVHTPTLPGLSDGDDPTAHSLDDVVDFVVDHIVSRDLRDVVLVGHSWGGYVITGAAHRLASRLARIVYWSAFVPADGAALLDEVPPEYQGLFTALAEASGNNSVTLPFEVFQQGFMADADPATQELVHSLLVPQPMQYFTTPVKPIDPATIGVPLTYLLSENDVALPPGEYGWARFAGRLGVEPVMCPGSHEACFTRPEELATAFLAAADGGAG